MRGKISLIGLISNVICVICLVSKCNAFVSSEESFNHLDIFYRQEIYAENAPKPVGPYSQAIKFGRTMYVSAVLGMDKDTMKLVPGGAEAEAKQALENLSAILEKANTCFAYVMKTTVYLHDMNDFLPVNKKYKEYFKHPYPARMTLQVAKLPLNAKVAIEAIVGVGDVANKPHPSSANATIDHSNQSPEEVHM